MTSFLIDDAVKHALPARYAFKSATPFGKSTWSNTAKIIAEDAMGNEALFFVKIAPGEHGGVMLRGEFESTREIYKLCPTLVPKPFGYGCYFKEHYSLVEFIDMDHTTEPDPDDFARKLSELHRKSESPNGKFGFHVVTCDGKMPHTVDWQDNWADFFASLLRGICKIDLEINGPWPELERATEQVISKVIPRLLGKLHHEGEPIKPCLIHGDIWEPNLGIRKDTGEVIMYDVGSYYAHNEMDLGQWRTEHCSYLRTQKVYTEAYLQHYPPAAPQDEFDDRNRLYSLKATFNWSAGHPEHVIVRQTAYNNMCYLCEKYAPIEGIDKYDPLKDPSVTGAGLPPTFINPPTC